MKALSKKLLTALAITFGLNGAVLAGEVSVLTTPTLFRGGPSGQNICVVTNVGKSPITVTVEMVTGFSGTIQETCTIQPDDPFGCQEAADDLAYCRVIVQGSAKKVRAIMMNRSTQLPPTIFTAVEAR